MKHSLIKLSAMNSYSDCQQAIEDIEADPENYTTETRAAARIGGHCELLKGAKEKIKALEKKADSFIPSDDSDDSDDSEEVNTVNEVNTVSEISQRTYGYGRVSTDEQTTSQQLTAIREAGHKVSDNRFIVDEGVSGGVCAMERPAFRNLVENKLEKGDTLVIAKLDRLGRDNIDVQQVVQMLTDKGIKLFILDLPVADLSSPEGKLMLQMFATFAEFEKNRISERIRDKLRQLKQEGKALGRPTKNVYDDVQELKAQGISQRTIADKLNVSLSTVRRNWIGTKRSLEVVTESGQ
ncbi:recombinase family protein [Vibrio cholerae]|uniref:recombinase family protein n=1 Tax=Vibrio cholerae TaxID=666 RepID=UPI0008421CAA|nr:recombinase family protein [Vibrio cholerae]